MLLTTQSLESVIDLPVSMPLTFVRASNWLVVASFRILPGQTVTFKNMNLTVIDASIDGVVLPLGNQCNQFNIALVNNSYGLAYIGIAKDYSSSNDPQTVTWVGTASDVVSANSVGIFTRSPDASELVISEAGDYSFVMVNNCAVNTSSSTTQLFNVDLRLVVSSQVRLNL